MGRLAVMSVERKSSAVEMCVLKPGGTGALCRAGMVGAMFVPAWQRVLPTAKDGIVLVVWTIEINEPPTMLVQMDSRTYGKVIAQFGEEG